ncbi:MAG: VWA domain-containing protein [Pyrinomonadaceae bacterium]
MSAGAASGGKSSVDLNGNRDNNPKGNIGAEVDSDLMSVPPIKAALPKLLVTNDFKRGSTPATSRLESGSHKGFKKHIYDGRRGRYTRSVGPTKAAGAVAMDATLRALITSRFAGSSDRSSFSSASLRQLLIPVAPGDLRFKLFKRKQGRLFIFAIDLSGSMAQNRIAQAKSVMLGLLRQSYIERDSVAIVGFRGTSAEILLPPSRSALRARRVLDALSIGGGTPLSAGLMCAIELARRAAAQSNGDTALLLFTDGHANVALRTRGMKDRAARRQFIEDEVKCLGSEMRKAGIDPVVVDTENAFTSNGDALALAENLGARYVHMNSSGIAGRNDGKEVRQRFIREP